MRQALRHLWTEKGRAGSNTVSFVIVPEFEVLVTASLDSPLRFLTSMGLSEFNVGHAVHTCLTDPERPWHLSVSRPVKPHGFRLGSLHETTDDRLIDDHSSA